MIDRENMSEAELVEFKERYWQEHGMTMGRWRCHPGTGEVFFDGRALPRLSIPEEDLLLRLWRVWPENRLPTQLEADLHLPRENAKVMVRRLRLKLCPEIIVTLPARGYSFNPDAVRA